MKIDQSILKRLAAAAVGLALFASLHNLAFGQQQVNLRFSWKLKGQYAALYVAKEKGYFAKEGLDVHLGEGAGAPAALGALLQGQDDVVLLPGIFALSAISQGMPVKLIALYVPKGPVALISKQSKPVRVPKDLEGKTLGASVGETGTTYMNTFCTINRVDCTKIKTVMIDSQARVPAFFQGNVDVVGIYLTNDLPIIEATGKGPFVLLRMDQYALDIPDMSLVSSDATIAKKPELLRKLLKAVGEGVAEARRDPAEAARLMLKDWPGGPSQSIVAAQVKATSEAIPVDTGKPTGWIDEKAIANALELLKSTGEIKAQRPDKEYFTNELLPAK